MPIYEYRCKTCAHDFQLLRSMDKASEDALCLQCRGRAVRKLSLIASLPRGGSGLEEGAGQACGCGGACQCGASLN